MSKLSSLRAVQRGVNNKPTMKEKQRERPPPSHPYLNDRRRQREREIFWRSAALFLSLSIVKVRVAGWWVAAWWSLPLSFYIQVMVVGWWSLSLSLVLSLAVSPSIFKIRVAGWWSLSLSLLLSFR